MFLNIGSMWVCEYLLSDFNNFNLLFFTCPGTEDGNQFMAKRSTGIFSFLCDLSILDMVSEIKKISNGIHIPHIHIMLFMQLTCVFCADLNVSHTFRS